MFTTTKPKMASIIATSSQHSTTLASKSCDKCQNIYDSLSNHLLAEHAQISVTESILSNVLLNILSLLSGNATGPVNNVVPSHQVETSCPQENIHFAPVNVISKAEKQRTSLPAKDHVTSNTFVSSSSMTSQNNNNSINNSDINTLLNNNTDLSTRPSFQSDLLSSLFTSLPQMTKIHDVHSLAKVEDLQEKLPKLQHVQTSSTSSKQNLIEPKLLQVHDSLDLSFMVPPGTNFSPAANLIAPDGSLTPAGISFILASQNKGSNSGKSDLDVADILVNKMPIPSLNKALDPGLYLQQLYLQQLAMSSQNTLTNSGVDFTSEIMNMAKGEDVSNESSSKCSTKSSNLNMNLEHAESIQQLIARHKQLSGLIEVLNTQKNTKKNLLKTESQYDQSSGSLSTYTINPQGVLGTSLPNMSLVQNNRNPTPVSTLTVHPSTLRQAAPTSTIKTNPNSKTNLNLNSNNNIKKGIPIIWDQVSTNLLHLVKQQPAKSATDDDGDFDEQMSDANLSENPNVDIKQNDLQAVQNIIIEKPKSIVVVTDSKNAEESNVKTRFSPVSIAPATELGNVEGIERKNVAKSKVLYKCNVCGVTFSVVSTLQAHLKTHIPEKKENCNYCHMSFMNKDEYYNHVLSHRGEENVFTCQYCQKIFTSKGDYSKHVIKHTQRRPFICSHCQKAFRDPGSLMKHERIHTGEQPYTCEICNRGFAEKSSLRKHVRVHSGEQPYKCKQCEKSFSISGNLQRHLFIHTGLRPFKCTQCTKAFNNPSHLRRHVKNLHAKNEGTSVEKSTSDSLVVPRGVGTGVTDLHKKEENAGYPSN